MRYSTRLALIVLLIAGFAGALWLLPVRDLTLALAERARGAGAAGIAVFFAAYVASTVALLPGSLLTLAAGFAYGPLWGLVVASPASVAGATAAFLLGRSVLREWVRRKIADFPRARAVDRAVGREGFKLVLLLRLSLLIPFNGLNYALSLSQVTLGRYVLASFIGMLPGTALYVYLGSLATAAAELSTRRAEGGGAQTALYVTGLVATVVVALVLAQAAGRALRDELGA
jgi:uncharacterized membrane protein YdjX (TVP38/TMEM64 family)